MNSTITKQKSVIIGKIWINGSKELIPATFTMPTDMVFEADEGYLLGNMSFRTDRNLLKPIQMKAKELLFLFANKKRTDKDPDYSVSIKRPEAEANEIIQNSKDKAQEWKNNNA